MKKENSPTTKYCHTHTESPVPSLIFKTPISSSFPLISFPFFSKPNLIYSHHLGFAFCSISLPHFWIFVFTLLLPFQDLSSFVPQTPSFPWISSPKSKLPNIFLHSHLQILPIPASPLSPLPLLEFSSLLFCFSATMSSSSTVASTGTASISSAVSPLPPPAVSLPPLPTLRPSRLGVLTNRWLDQSLCCITRNQCPMKKPYLNALFVWVNLKKMRLFELFPFVHIYSTSTVSTFGCKIIPIAHFVEPAFLALFCFIDFLFRAPRRRIQSVLEVKGTS